MYVKLATAYATACCNHGGFCVYMQVYGTDLSQVMVEDLQRKAAESPRMYANVHASVCNATDLSAFESGAAGSRVWVWGCVGLCVCVCRLTHPCACRCRWHNDRHNGRGIQQHGDAVCGRPTGCFRRDGARVAARWPASSVRLGHTEHVPGH